jgi:amidase
MIPFADGSDLAASVRNPASFCGLTGLRTTPGLVPSDVIDPLAAVGPIARSAQDAALLLAGLCSADSGRPLARPDRAADFVALRPASLRGPRVAGLTGSGLPVGLRLVGRYGADLRLLQIAAAISELVPPVFP